MSVRASRRAEESVLIPCPHCRFPIPLDPRRDFDDVRRGFLCPACTKRSHFPAGARLAGVGAMVAVIVVVFGLAKMMGLSTDTWTGALITVALLCAVVPFAIAAMSAANRRWTRRLVK